QHSRGVAVDDSRRRQAEEACAGDEECLKKAAGVPLDVYVANRSPNSLLIGRTDRVAAEVAAGDLPTFHNNIPLTAGPSQVRLGTIVDQNGEKQLRVFVVCFDSALIYIYDPVLGRVETEIFTGRGPQSITFDTQEPLAYIGHFTDSYVGVVSLDQRHFRTYGAMLATIGKPTSPRATQ
ncbi:MAG: hypothetical protein MK135_08830, partial [Polyangiaceae bacterium]|nr:hypothetical protein [Polyangiaceae bacterium]